jgi:hypothetical protein
MISSSFFMIPRTLRIALIVSALAAFSTGVAANTVRRFRDVPPDHWAADAIEWVSEHGIITGPADRPGTFRPDHGVSRAELAVVVKRLYDFIEKPNSDVKPSVPGLTDEESMNNTKRWKDIRTILDAVREFAADSHGALPAGLSDVPREICRTGIRYCTLLNLTNVARSYLSGLPVDPDSPPKSDGTGYWISKDSVGRVTVSAPLAEGDVAITVTE